MNNVKQSLFKSVNDLCDVLSVLIRCSADNTVLLVLDTPTEYWIPSIKASEDTFWINDLNREVLQEIFGCNVRVGRLLHMFKVWIPGHKTPYICHYIFEVDVNPDLKKKSKTPTFKYKNKVRWVTEPELGKLVQSNTVRSPELALYFSLTKPKPSLLFLADEHLTNGSLTEITDSVLVLGKSTMYEQTVEACNLQRAAQEVIYREFLLTTFPALFLNAAAFARLLADMGWPREEAADMFRSADVGGRGALSFRELVYFLAATEPGTAHGGVAAEVRCRYIFRYLDASGSNVLQPEDVRRLLTMIRKSRRQPLEPARVEREVRECYKELGLSETQTITMLEFLRAVGEMKLRGTSYVYRAPGSVHKYVKDITERRQRTGRGSDVVADIIVPLSKPVSYSKGQLYELAVHCVKIEQNSQSVEVEQMWNIDNATSVTSMPTKPCNETSRRISVNQFDQNSKSNELLKTIRHLNAINKCAPHPGKVENFNFTWGTLNSAVVGQNIINVCEQVKEIFVREPRLLDVTAPAYIMGDLHGNFPSLLNFEHLLWRVGPGLCPCNILFLGDYVDRGLYSLEVVCYLFCYKLQSPKKIHVLRGNHEIKKVQQQWTFERECKIKFGDKLGTGVFNAINDVFDRLPLAAVIDGRVFCCHGGIPPPWLCPVATAINDIPSVLTDPQDQSSLAWELLWNDPIRTKNVSEKVAMEMLANEGFAANTHRGTAHVFSVEALEKFLSANGFSFLVRAHEVVEAGFYLQQKGHLVTVFSSSKYCGGQNVAACLLADQGKLRILRLKTE